MKLLLFGLIIVYSISSVIAAPASTTAPAFPLSSPSAFGGDNDHHNDDTVAIIAVVGGIVFLILLVFVIWWRLRQRGRIEERQLELQIQQTRLEQLALQSTSLQVDGNTGTRAVGADGTDTCKGADVLDRMIELPPPSYPMNNSRCATQWKGEKVLNRQLGADGHESEVEPTKV